MRIFYIISLVAITAWLNTSAQTATNRLSNDIRSLLRHIKKATAQTTLKLERFESTDLVQLVANDEKLLQQLYAGDSSLNTRLGIDSFKIPSKQGDTLFNAITLTEQQERVLSATEFASSKFGLITSNQQSLSSFAKLSQNNLRLKQMEEVLQNISERSQMWSEIMGSGNRHVQRLKSGAAKATERLLALKKKSFDFSRIEQRLLETVQDMPGFESFFLARSTWAQAFQLGSPIGFENGLNQHLQTLGTNQQLVSRVQQIAGQSLNSIAKAKQVADTLTNAKKAFEESGANEQKKPSAGKSDSESQREKIAFRFRPDLQFNSSSNLLPGISQVGFTMMLQPYGKGWEIGQTIVAMTGWSGGNFREFSLEGMGYRSFVQVPIWRETKFYAGFEISLLTRLIPDGEMKNWSKYLVGTGLVGVSRRINVGKLQTEMLVAYDLGYARNPLQPSPWVIRTAFNLFNKPH